MTSKDPTPAEMKEAEHRITQYKLALSAWARGKNLSELCIVMIEMAVVFGLEHDEAVFRQTVAGALECAALQVRTGNATGERH